MSDPQSDWFVFWIRFGCSFVFFGLLLGLVLLRLRDIGTFPAPAVWTLATIGVSIYAAKLGDVAGYKLLNIFRWW